ncbi:MAG: pyruvate ferredoxin oxidoreductase [Patescibacteria group bacterium]|jgi:pyruvate ferredoxin oxidoreductase alpha subunit
MKNIIEGSRAVALTIKMCKPGVVSAYPITPQTHIVEDLARFKADGEADYQYLIAESEFAAASIVLGSSLGGVRSYTASSSQGLLLMTEVLFSIAGLRAPIVLTCANRAISSPINIWNDQQDALTMRDSGWIMLYCEDNQEAIDLHIQAYKIAEAVKFPVMVNMDGFILTHTYEPVDLPGQKEVDAFLPAYKPKRGFYLDSKNPASFGPFVTPTTYMEQRQEMFGDFIGSKTVIKKVAAEFAKKFGRKQGDGLVEYIGSGNEDVVLVAMGSIVGTLRESKKGVNFGILKIKTFRPFPDEEVLKKLSKAKYIAVVDKSISMGAEGILAMELKRVSCGRLKGRIKSFVVGLGGKDITIGVIEKIVKEVKKSDDKIAWVYPE